MTKYKKPTYIIIQEAMAERIRFLEDELYERGGYPSIKQIEMIAKTYDVNPAWLVGWIDDEMMPGVQVVEKVVYKESPTARLPDYFNNNNEGKIIKWKQSRRFRGGRI